MRITAENTADGITWFIILALVAAGIFEIWQMQWSNLFIVAQALVLSLIPYGLKKKYDIHTPNLLRAGIVAFMFATLFLGQIRNFYTTYAWWDAVLHWFSSVCLTLIGFILLSIFFKNRRLQATPFFTAVLALSFALAGAVLWEIYEFILDEFFAPQEVMQPSNIDTMVDLIAALIGGLMVCFGGYRYFKYKEDGIAASIIKEAERNNVPIEREQI